MIRVHCGREARQANGEQDIMRIEAGHQPIQPDIPWRIIVSSGRGQRPGAVLNPPEKQGQIRSTLDGKVPSVLVATHRPGHVR